MVPNQKNTSNVDFLAKLPPELLPNIFLPVLLSCAPDIFATAKMGHHFVDMQSLEIDPQSFIFLGQTSRRMHSEAQSVYKSRIKKDAFLYQLILRKNKLFAHENVLNTLDLVWMQCFGNDFFKRVMQRHDNYYQQIFKHVKKWAKTSIQPKMVECVIERVPEIVQGYRSILADNVHRFIQDYPHIAQDHTFLSQYKLSNYTHIPVHPQDQTSQQRTDALCTFIAQTLVHHPSSVFDTVNKNRTFLLHWAVRHSDTMLVAQLLATGINPNFRNKQGHTPLHAAASTDNEAAIEMLIAAGANPNMVSMNSMHWTPLHTAAHYQSVKAISALAAAGANINMSDAGGQRPLHIAAWRATAPTIQTLCNLGADIDVYDNGGETPLQHAAAYCNIAAINALVACGARQEMLNWYDAWTVTSAVCVKACKDAFFSYLR